MWWNKKKQKDSDFAIIFYPKTNVYVAKYKGDFLKESYLSKFITATEYLFAAKLCKSEEEATLLIDKFREQVLSENVKNINYVSKNKD